MNESVDSCHLFRMIGNRNVFDVVLLCCLSDFWRGVMSRYNFPNTSNRQCRETSFAGWHSDIGSSILSPNTVPAGLSEGRNFGMNIGIVFVEKRPIVGNTDNVITGIWFRRLFFFFVHKDTRHAPLLQFRASCDDQTEIHKVFIGR